MKLNSKKSDIARRGKKIKAIKPVDIGKLMRAAARKRKP